MCLLILVNLISGWKLICPLLGLSLMHGAVWLWCLHKKYHFISLNDFNPFQLNRSSRRLPWFGCSNPTIRTINCYESIDVSSMSLCLFASLIGSLYAHTQVNTNAPLKTHKNEKKKILPRCIVCLWSIQLCTITTTKMAMANTDWVYLLYILYIPT